MTRPTIRHWHHGQCAQDGCPLPESTFYGWPSWSSYSYRMWGTDPLDFETPA